MFYTKKGEICSPDLTALFCRFIAFYCVLYTRVVYLAKDVNHTISIQCF